LSHLLPCPLARLNQIIQAGQSLSLKHVLIPGHYVYADVVTDAHRQRVALSMNASGFLEPVTPLQWLRVFFPYLIRHQISDRVQCTASYQWRIAGSIGLDNVDGWITSKHCSHDGVQSLVLI